MKTLQRGIGKGDQVRLTGAFVTGTGHRYEVGSQGKVAGTVNGHLLKVLMDQDADKSDKAPVMHIPRQLITRSS